MEETPHTAEKERLCGACYDGEHRAHRASEGCDCVRCSPTVTAETGALTAEERQTLDERIAGGWWGYYIHFDPTGVPEVDRVLSAVGLAGKMYHNTEAWNDDDADYGPVRKGESPADFIQRTANDAAMRLRPEETT